MWRFTDRLGCHYKVRKHAGRNSELGASAGRPNAVDDGSNVVQVFAWSSGSVRRLERRGECIPTNVAERERESPLAPQALCVHLNSLPPPRSHIETNVESKASRTAQCTTSHWAQMPGRRSARPRYRKHQGQTCAPGGGRTHTERFLRPL